MKYSKPLLLSFGVILLASGGMFFFYAPEKAPMETAREYKPSVEDTKRAAIALPSRSAEEMMLDPIELYELIAIGQVTEEEGLRATLYMEKENTLHHLTEGELLPYNVLLKRIGEDSVVLMHDNLEYTLRLDVPIDMDAPVLEASPQRQISASSRSQEIVQAELPRGLIYQQVGREEINPETGEMRLTLDNDELDEIRAHLGQIFFSARPQLAFRDGELIGIQVNNSPEGGLIEHFGFHEGDIITHLDGQKISDPGQLMMNLYNDIPDYEAVIHYERDGKILERRILFE